MHMPIEGVIGSHALTPTAILSHSDRNSDFDSDVPEKYRPRSLLTADQQAWKRSLVQSVQRCPLPKYFDSDERDLGRSMDTAAAAGRDDLRSALSHLLNSQSAVGITRAAMQWLLELADRLAWYLLHTARVWCMGDEWLGIQFDDNSKLSSPIRLRHLPEQVRQRIKVLIACTETMAENEMANAEIIVPPQIDDQVARRWIEQYQFTMNNNLPSALQSAQTFHSLALTIEFTMVQFFAAGAKQAREDLKSDMITVDCFRYTSDHELATLITFLTMDDPLCAVAGDEAMGMRAPSPTSQPAASLRSSASSSSSGELPLQSCSSHLLSPPQKQFRPFQSFDDAMALEFPARSNNMDAAGRASWYHDAVKVRKYANSYATGDLLPGDDFFFRQHHIRPVQTYGIGTGFNEFSECLASANMLMDMHHVSFDIIDANGKEWPFHLQLAPNCSETVGILYLRGPCDGNLDSRWYGWQEKVGAIFSQRAAHEPRAVAITDREHLGKAYRPWKGLKSSDVSSSDTTSIPFPLISHLSLLGRLRYAAEDSECLRELLSHHYLSKNIARWPLQYRSQLEVAQARLFQARRSEARCSAEQRAARLELEQLIGIASALPFPTFPSHFWSANHPMSVRVLFTHTLLMRLFNGTDDHPVSSAFSFASSEELRSTDSGAAGWMPNVLLHIIAEYVPADLPYIQE